MVCELIALFICQKPELLSIEFEHFRLGAFGWGFAVCHCH
jgi:hypothetical protein